MRKGIHRFLKWFPTALGASAISIAAVWSSARDWIGTQVIWAWGLMADPWIAFAVLVSVAAYIAAILLTGETEPTPKQNNVAPDMPLHIAVRYLARDSAWAANLPARLDKKWVEEVASEFMSKLMLGHVTAFGRFKKYMSQPNIATDTIPLDYLKNAGWRSWDLVGPSPPSHFWRDSGLGGGVYYRVMVNRKQVEEAWPKRTLWQRFQGQSPIDRLNRLARDGKNYEDIFAEQDASYRRLIEGLDDGDDDIEIMDAAFGEGPDAVTPR